MAITSVLTGGPGAGKTTLCDKLSDRIGIVPESGRAVLMGSGGHQMRADRPLDYSLEILRLDIENFKKAANLRCNLLFDRGFADNAGFLDLMGLTKPKGLDEACCNMRYNGPIFVAPLWREIYQMDSDRIQDWEEAKATHIAVCAAWKQYGYDFVELPKADVGERENFVRQRMA